MLWFRVTCTSSSNQQLQLTVSQTTFIASFSDLPYNVQYTCCVEAGFMDSRKNASTCATARTDEGGKGSFLPRLVCMYTLTISLALPTLYPKSKGRRVWYAEFCTVTRNFNQNAFSALDITKVDLSLVKYPPLTSILFSFRRCGSSLGTDCFSITDQLCLCYPRLESTSNPATKWYV